MAENDKEKKSPLEALEDIKKRYGGGGFIDPARGTGDFSRIYKDIDAAGKRFTAGMNASLSPLESFVGFFTGETTKLKSDVAKGTSDFKTAMQSLATGNGSIKDVGKVATAMAGQLGAVMTRSVSAGITLIGDIVGIGADIVTIANKKMAMAWNGVEGSFKVATSTISDGFKAMGGSFAKIGGMLDGVFDNAIRGIMFRFEDILLANKARLRESSRTGETGRPASMAVAVTGGLKGSIGRVATEEMVSGLAEMGALQKLINTEGIKNDAQLKQLQASNRVLINQEMGRVDTLLKIGMTQGKSNAEMREELKDQQTLTGNNVAATKQLSQTWGAAQSIVYGTNLSLKDTAKTLKDTAMNARFMNVDLKTIANTMNVIKEGEAGLRSMGMSLKADGPKILGDWTNASAKATDALHMFFGTKGGTTTGGDPFKGMLASKYGSTFAESLKSTGGGGFTAKEGKSGDMYANNLKVMKEYMEKASAGASTDAEKFAIQQRVATEVFKMGTEGANALALADSSKLDALIKNEAIVKEFKTEKDYLSQLQSTAVRTENIQRAMTSLSLTQLQVALKSVVYLSDIAIATVAAVTEDKDKPGDLIESLKSRSGRMASDAIESMASMAGNTRQVFDVIKSYIPKEMRSETEKIMDNVERMTNAAAKRGLVTNKERQTLETHSKQVIEDINYKVPPPSLLRKRAEGGSVTANDIFWVGERGPELFSPTTSGTVNSHAKSMSMMESMLNLKDRVPTGMPTAKNENLSNTMKLELSGAVGGTKETLGKESKSNDALISNLVNMKEAMIEGSKSGKTSAEKLFIQQKIATEVFKLSGKEATALAMLNINNIKKEPVAALKSITTEKISDKKETTNALKSITTEKISDKKEPAPVIPNVVMPALGALIKLMESKKPESVGTPSLDKLVAAMESKKPEPMKLENKETSPLGGRGTQIIMNFTGVLDKDKLISMITEASREALLAGGA